MKQCDNFYLNCGETLQNYKSSEIPQKEGMKRVPNLKLNTQQQL